MASPGQDEVKYLPAGIVDPTGEELNQIFDCKRTMEVESYLQAQCKMLDKHLIFLRVGQMPKPIPRRCQAHFLRPMHSKFYVQQIYALFLLTDSPGLNRTECRWRQMRADVSHNSFSPP